MVRRSRVKRAWWRVALGAGALALLLSLSPASAQLDLRPHLGLHSVPVRRVKHRAGPSIENAFLDTNDDLRLLTIAAALLFGAYLLARSQRLRLDRQNRVKRQAEAQRQAQRLSRRRSLTG